LSVAEGFNETIAGAVIKVQRLKGNGKPGPELPAGHLEGIPPWEPGYCCSKSKFNVNPPERITNAGLILNF